MVKGDASPMADVWAHWANVTTMHPIGGLQIGWDKVQTAWKEVAEISSDGEVHRDDQHIRAIGDVAYEVGVELVGMTPAGESVNAEMRATNVCWREDGTWKIIHHHTDTDPAMEGILTREQVA